ncbi:ATP-binding protein [Candidatus Palauibacter sp.]|uniref:hybrid sensor histidine kinase/response regulator n=1 Tax=Candidatus Palauibacter sp. TaxID=3101350 RepID=UPI003B014C3F
MTGDSSELQREIEALRERVSRLSAAVLRANASLDLDTVLQEVVDSARALTGARYGVIATLDAAGEVEAFVTSGFTAAEEEDMVAWTEGPQLFEHFRRLGAPVRVGDLPDYVRALGFSPDLIRSRTMQGAPLRHRDIDIGNFFLAEKEGGREFTDADEEVLTLFAAQAATAIANARAHREERRARADLETLIETSPVGVVVFDGRTGELASFNREARRIVDALNTPGLAPGLAPAQLLEAVTCHRADGREASLAELPMAQLLGTAETVRAEEITLSVPNGRSVTTLVNSTPIQADDGTVVSVVVTMQDLEPLEDLERMRAEFLGIVSHELRTPLISIKGSTATVLGASPAPDPAEMLQFFRVIDDQADRMRGLIAELLDHGRIVTGTLSVSPEPAEVAALVDQARSTFVSGTGRHDLAIDLPADLPRVLADRARIVQVLSNLLANAAKYSPESSPIRIDAAREGVHVAISVSDEGRGVPPDRLPYLFRKHAAALGGDGERREAGAGLGLTICKGLVEAHGGRIWAESEGEGQGARFTFTVPVAEELETAPERPAVAGPRAARQGRETTRILVVDDDPQMLRYLRDALAGAGYAPVVTGDPEEVASLVATHRPALVLLDLLLPGTDGIALMERVPELSDVPVILISAYGRDETIVRALDAGAADYIVKPFSPSELTARVRAALRRVSGPQPFVLGDLAIRYDQRRVAVAGEAVQLTPTEYELLRVLSVNAGRVLTHESLLRQAWRGGDRRSPDPKLVRAVVKRLRRKLGDDAASPAYIRNERGVGYFMPAGSP